MNWFCSRIEQLVPVQVPPSKLSSCSITRGKAYHLDVVLSVLDFPLKGSGILHTLLHLSSVPYVEMNSVARCLSKRTKFSSED